MLTEYSKQNTEDTYLQVRFISTNKNFHLSTLTYYLYEWRFENTIPLNTPTLKLEFWIPNRQNQHKNNNRLAVLFLAKIDSVLVNDWWQCRVLLPSSGPI